MSGSIRTIPSGSARTMKWPSAPACCGRPAPASPPCWAGGGSPCSQTPPWRRCIWTPVTASLEDAGFSVCSRVFPAGEGSKNLSTLSDLLEFLASEHLTRTDCVAALGGGVTGDMAGFAAAVYLRGIRYVQLPTTLLAAVDSSGGARPPWTWPPERIWPGPSASPPRCSATRTA